MTDIGRILYLPPPVQPGRGSATGPGRADLSPVRPTNRVAADGLPGSGSPSEGIGTEEQREARHFRFRVHVGGRDEKLAGDGGIPTAASAAARNTDGAAQANAAQANSERRKRQGDGLQHASFSAPFLAQLIAQEQLAAGLHDPPHRAADRAYRQAGADPSLVARNGASHFRMAV